MPYDGATTKNREFETLTEIPWVDGMKVRVWRKAHSFEQMLTRDNDDLRQACRANIDDAVALLLTLEAIEDVSAIAVTDAAGNGATLYPDWRAEPY
jgi:hypothetical protein